MSDVSFATERKLALVAAIEVACGYRPAITTAIRWATKGVRGHRLEAAKMGAKWVCSVEAARRFFEATNPPAEPRLAEGTDRRPTPRATTKRERDIARAEAELEAEGV